MAYIYQITNKTNGKIYIGKTERTLRDRWNEHCSDYKNRDYENRPLYRAMKKYGIENFIMEEIEETNQPNEREIYWISKKGSFKYGYNATLGGEGFAYIDRELVVKTYERVKSCTEVAKILSIGPDTVSNILKEKNIVVLDAYVVNKQKRGKMVMMCTLDNKPVRSFSSLKDAARFLIEHCEAQGKLSGITVHIREVCNGKRKTAYRYKWQFI